MIYATQFDTTTKQATGPSEPAGFDSIDQVRDLMGPPSTDGKRIVIYDNVAFTEYVIALPARVGYIDTKSNKGA